MKIKIKHLPDINSYRHLPDEYENYGRFGLTNNNNFYVSGIHSQHARNTAIGGYWATSSKDDILYLSPRGVKDGFEKFIANIINDGRINKILKMAGKKQIINEMSENRFRGLTGSKQPFVVERLGVDVDKQGSDAAYEVMQSSLIKMGYKIEILKAGRFGFDPKIGWLFDDTMMSSGHPNNWIPGSRGYYAITKKSVLLFPKNDMQFQQDGIDNKTFVQDLSEMLGKQIRILNENVVQKNKLNTYLEKIKAD